MNRNYNVACLKMIEVSVPDYEVEENAPKPPLLEVCTTTDLAYYISLSALMSCDRLTLKNTVLKSNFMGLVEGQGMDALTLIEAYLNGNYQEFQRCLHNIERYLKYDPFFGKHKQSNESSVFTSLRLKALQ